MDWSETIGMIYGGCIAFQLILSLIFMPIFVPRKWSVLGFEAKLDDGEDIAVFMFCTFGLLLAPILCWFALLWVIIGIKQWIDVRSIPKDVLEILKESYCGNHNGLESACYHWLETGEIKYFNREDWK